MPLTPEDVAAKVFTTVRLKEGYDEDEVDAFLDEVQAELARLYSENDDLRSRLAAAERSLATRPPAETPATPAPTPAPTPTPAPAPAAPPPPAEAAAGILALAQRTADEHVAEAKGQAEKVLAEARAHADRLRREAEDKHRQALGSLEHERANLERKIDELRAFERDYRSRLKSYFEGQLRDLEAGDAGSRPVGAVAGTSQSFGQHAHVTRDPSSTGAAQGGGWDGGEGGGHSG
jgi:DivIVA domain-containing protein